MVCPRCGQSHPPSARQCNACGGDFVQTTVVRVIQFDTTGLPPAATFGATTVSGTTVLDSVGPVHDRVRAVGGLLALARPSARAITSSSCSVLAAWALSTRLGTQN